MVWWGSVWLFGYSEGNPISVVPSTKFLTRKSSEDFFASLRIMSVFAGLVMPARTNSPKRPRTDTANSGDPGSSAEGTSSKGNISKKQADNLDHRMRQVESMQRTTFKFKKDNGHHLIKYCAEAIENYAANNPGGGDPHPWGAKKNRYCPCNHGVSG